MDCEVSRGHVWAELGCECVLWGEEGAIVKRGDADVLRACG